MFRAVDLKVQNGNMRPFAHLCLGDGKVDEIVRWTEPADMFGQKLTQVTYRYSATNLPATLPADDRRQLETPQEAKATLVQTSDGWQKM